MAKPLFLAPSLMLLIACSGGGGASQAAPTPSPTASQSSAPTPSASVQPVEGLPAGLPFNASLEGHFDNPFAIAFLPDGRLLVVSMHDRCVLRLDGDELVVHADLTGLATFHANDMVVDAAGRAYVGNFGWNPRATDPEHHTPLIVVEPDGTARYSGGELDFPNGIVIAPDGRILSIAHNVTPMSDEVTPSGGVIRGVLEIGAGRAAALGLRPGDRVHAGIFPQ